VNNLLALLKVSEMELPAPERVSFAESRYELDSFWALSALERVLSPSFWVVDFSESVILSVKEGSTAKCWMVLLGWTAPAILSPVLETFSERTCPVDF
jgi:hypothetical protein